MVYRLKRKEGFELFIGPHRIPFHVVVRLRSVGPWVISKCRIGFQTPRYEAVLGRATFRKAVESGTVIALK